MEITAILIISTFLKKGKDAKEKPISELIPKIQFTLAN